VSSCSTDISNSAPAGARLRVDNLHYDLTEDDLDVQPPPPFSIQQYSSLGASSLTSRQEPLHPHRSHPLAIPPLRPRRPLLRHRLRNLRIPPPRPRSSPPIRRRERQRATHPPHAHALRPLGRKPRHRHPRPRRRCNAQPLRHSRQTRPQPFRADRGARSTTGWSR